MFLVLFPVAVAGVEILLKGASFSQLCRLSFSLLFVSWLVVAGGGQVAVVTGHEAKLLWPSHALDDGAKVTWNNLTSIAPLVYRYSFLFLGWNGFSLNKLWPIINYHLLLSCLHLMSCDSLLAVAGTASQLVPLHCSPLLVVVCCFWGGQGALLGTTVWGNASST